MKPSALLLNMLRPRLLLLLLVLLDVSSGDLEDVVAVCTNYRRCNCAMGVSGGKPALARVNNRYIKKLCTGVLINDFFILSSAECGAGVDQMDPDISVFLDNSDERAVSKIFLHPDHLPDMLPRMSDIMLLRLKYKVDMKVNIPICLPQASLITYQGAYATIMAPGKESVSVRINGRECSFRQQVRGPVTTIRVRADMFLCVGEVNTRFCSPPPGNLLVKKEHGWYSLVGLSTTHNVFPMCSNSMGLFTAVLPYREWIRNIINQQGASQCQFVQ